MLLLLLLQLLRRLMLLVLMLWEWARGWWRAGARGQG
jgi:hypothetical protein